MQGIKRPAQHICARCLRVKSSSPNGPIRYQQRFQSNATSPLKKDDDGEAEQPRQEEKETGALSRRLAQMSEESIETGGKSAANAVKEAGFSEELKRQLEEKIAGSHFKNDNASAFAQVSVPSSAGQGSRHIAAAQPWTGTETTEDAALRMLTDAHKPIRSAPKIPGIRGPPSRIDTGRPVRQKNATGTRLANARDKTSMYEFSKDASLSESEKEKLRQEMKARFTQGARATPTTIQGLASLANERIEDAIARGQFKNLPRGQKLERDYNASSPFIDTTEYFMNKIIQRQEIVPPWIEKQQEVVSTATKFRSRLRADWKRHVSRTISSRGGGLERQLQLAKEYAFAEALENPQKKKEEKINAVDASGHVSQITLAGELKATPVPEAAATANPEDETSVENEIKVMEQTFNDDGTLRPPEEQITIAAEQPEIPVPPESVEQAPRKPTVPPFRDPDWQRTELSYHRAAIDNLNALTRSYNLMAPNLAKKPYFSLERELKACFAYVAPQVAAAIKDRAVAPRIKGVEVVGHKAGGVLERFSIEDRSKVYDDRRPEYGFKQFWKDLFTGGKT